ncbi:IclR family transcriptional regulator [Novosphingobium piscinae]|uniref:IclR family transcriptional regulator n=1 Tax=Novosphingobium piscinae TaxID=1507448 RepID=A0A7X1KND9_9SPHN|nr:IclR family transcriptional regulator [Novosphingobium piscinae]MBC2667589.1 IclR family transcriptional regulator [Novosphingobium piscinae]
MASRSGTQAGVKSALRTLDLLEFVVAQPGGVVAQDIAVALAIPVSSLSYLLATLVERDYLRRDGRRYGPGAGLDRLRRPAGAVSVVDQARPLVRGLVQQLNETASLFLPRGHEIETVLTEMSSQPLRYAIEPGTRTPFHCLAGGKAMLAALDDARLDALLGELELARFTANTVTDEAALRREIAEIRKAGVAFTRDEYTPGISGVGVALRREGEVVGALGVAAPTSRFTDAMRDRIVAQLQRAAATFSAA